VCPITIEYAILTVAILASPAKASTSQVKVEPVASGSKTKAKGKGKAKDDEKSIAQMVQDELDPHAHLEILYQERLRHIAQLHVSFERIRDLDGEIKELQEDLD
jgi:hypothetical protein